MSLTVRRVVTGHDKNGHAIVADRRDRQERHPAGPARTPP